MNSIPDTVALKKVFMDKTITQAKMQNVIKEVEFLTTLEHKFFIKSFYSFFD